MPDKKYNPAEIEEKWQGIWEEKKLNVTDIKGAKRPFYNLWMFPYPSGEGLHVGHAYASTASDIYGRFKTLHGFNVFEPFGYDSFGIHSENYALKIGQHPAELTDKTTKHYEEQIKRMGHIYDWTRTVTTSHVSYYKFTQWLFITMYNAGLAYRDSASVNWCPKDKTVLSDEQVIDGKCERCGSEVEKRELEQWFFRITKYADRLLKNLETLDWSEKVKVAQKNWIGKSEGVEIDWQVNGETITTFTTRTDTIPGVTFIVISPESSYVQKLVVKSEEKQVAKYIAEAKNKDVTLRGKEKTGVFTGSFAKNPFNGKSVPVYVADYVLAGYGTGAVMGMPGHDSRDRDFAKLFDLEKVLTTELPDAVDKEEVYTGEGKQINSGKGFDGFSNKEAAAKILKALDKDGKARSKTQYHLRDWLVSRQRYWGAPIPMIYCEKCQWVPVPEKDLPVELPFVKDYQPEGTGRGPLANHPEFYEATCPNCGKKARRETDVMDTFVDSSWYFLRYPSVGSKTEGNLPFDSEITKKWLPVHMYTGGAEHSVLHLLYSRFVTMALFDLKLINFEEPFTKFFAHGMIIKDGAKMSKSKGNVVNPDEYIAKYGADALRLYLMFMGPVDQGGDFRDTGMQGMRRWVERVWRTILDQSDKKSDNDLLGYENKIKIELNKLITKANSDFEARHNNTVISSMMEFINLLNEANSKKVYATKEQLEKFLIILSPFAPHLAEELYQQLHSVIPGGDPESSQKETSGSQLTMPAGRQEAGMTKRHFVSVHQQPWPELDKHAESNQSVVVAIMINGKTRGTVTVSGKISQNQEEVEKLAKNNEKVKGHLEGKSIKKVIFVPGKVLNFVVTD